MALETDDRSRQREHEHHCRHDLVGMVDQRGAALRIPADERADHHGDHDAGIGRKKRLKPVVVIAIRVLCAGERQKIPVRPVEPE